MPAQRRPCRRCRRAGRLAIVAVVFQLVEFGYFLIPGLALTAPVGIACQAAWYVWLGRILRRTATPRPTARPSPCRRTDFRGTPHRQLLLLYATTLAPLCTGSKES